jgi:hypothetical protein
MDMTAGFIEEVRARCPKAKIVFDLFHVVAKYGREVIDRVRVDEANRLRDDRQARYLVKSTRWLLLRNRENVTRAEDQVRLNELLAANKALMTVYVLKDDLKALWRYRHIGYARIFWKGWRRRALASRIPALKTFVQRLTPYIEGILAHCRWPLGTNRASTTPSKSSNAWPTASGTTTTSSSGSGPPSPEIREEPLILVLPVFAWSVGGQPVAAAILKLRDNKIAGRATGGCQRHYCPAGRMDGL